MKPNRNYSTKKLLRALIGAGMAGTSLFQLALPVLAQNETRAGTVITNTATATYDDDDDATNGTFSTNSNTVTITIAEVAGITVEPVGVNDLNDGSVQTGDTLYFDFKVTNTGNDPTRFFLPGLNNIAVVGVETNTNERKPDSVTVISRTIAGVTEGTPTTPLTINVPDAGGITDAIGGLGTLSDPADPTSTRTGSFNPGDSLVVRVAVTVETDPTDQTAPISVTYGNTGANNNTAGTQNQPTNGSTNPNEVRTVDNADALGAPEIAGGPVNGEREASAFQETNLGTEIAPQALLKVNKQYLTISTGATTSPADDLITYRLDATVENASPSGSVEPANLTGTNINLDGTANTVRILVSDAIPENTEYDNSFTPTEPGSWSFVYTTSPLSTNALNAQWVEPDLTVPNVITDAIAEDITRVGWVHNGPINTTAPGNSTDGGNGLQFRVITTGIPAAGGNVYNIAQGFGTTEGGDPADPNDLVYDESGDNKPNNISDNGTLPNGPDGNPDAGGGFNPDDDNGVADPDADGLDNSNDNSGEDTDPNVGGGEDNTAPIGPGQAPASANILNGPDGQPAAVNKTDDDDFQNKAIPFTTSDPNTVTFTNTVQNNTSNAANDPDLNNIVLLPLTPEVADSVNSEPEDFGTNADIPVGTTVTITYDPDQNNDDNRSGNVYASYRYVDGDNNLDTTNDRQWERFGDQNNLTTDPNGGPNFINIPTLSGVGSTLDYTVEVTLPNNSDGTEDLRDGQGVGIPIVAFTNNNNAADFNPTTNTINNITVDRVYLGYLVCAKDARILNADGTELIPFTAAANNEDNQTLPASANTVPGNIIEYRVVCTNSSQASVGTNNVVLNANNVVITEDGTLALEDNTLPTTSATKNNWALNNSAADVAAAQVGINTSNVIGSATATSTGSTTPTITYGEVTGNINNTTANTVTTISDRSGPDIANDVSVYTVNAGTLAPGQSVTFTFQRKIN